jgi:hypothetical protein
METQGHVLPTDPSPAPEGQAPPAEQEATVPGLMGAGASVGEALAWIHRAQGPERFQAALAAECAKEDTPAATVAILNSLGTHDPTLALDSLEGWLRQRGSRVQGDLTLAWEAHWATRLPQDLVVEGTLDLSDRWTLPALPDGITAKNLNLSACESLTALPWGIRLSGYLDVGGCPELKALPHDLTVGGDLILDSICPLSALTDAELRTMAPGITGRIVRMG